MRISMVSMESLGFMFFVKDNENMTSSILASRCESGLQKSLTLLRGFNTFAHLGPTGQIFLEMPNL